jgi:hypothetical protein
MVFAADTAAATPSILSKGAVLDRATAGETTAA